MRISFHALERARERVGINLTPEDALAIREGIRNGTFFKLNDAHAGGSVYTVVIRGKQFNVVVNDELTAIITVKSVGMSTIRRGASWTKYLGTRIQRKPPSEKYRKRRREGWDD